MAGGGLRLADSFTTAVLSNATLAVLYLVTDVLLLAAVAGIWWWHRRTLDPAGRAGLTIAVAGTLVIRVAAFDVLGTSGYQLGAIVELVGLAVYSVDTLLRRIAARPALLTPVRGLPAVTDG